MVKRCVELSRCAESPNSDDCAANIEDKGVYRPVDHVGEDSAPWVNYTGRVALYNFHWDIPRDFMEFLGTKEIP